MDRRRCRWCNLNNPVYVAYHDKTWGIPEHDDRKLFEMLVLETFQAGLSWEIILNKRQAFDVAFDSMDPNLIRLYDEQKILSLLHESGIIRNRRKIEATVQNAGIFLDIQKEWGSFDSYIWHFTEGKTIYEVDRTSSSLSDFISKDLKKRGMKFVGTTIIYAYLQAIGIIYSHDVDCYLYRSK